MTTTVLTLKKEKTMEGLVKELKGLLRDKDMQVQSFELRDGNYVIQGRSTDWKLMQFIGGDRAVTIKLTLVGTEKAIMEVGEGKWLDKIGGALIGWYLTWPVMLWTAVSTYRQVTLPKKIIRCAQKYLEDKETVEPHK